MRVRQRDRESVSYFVSEYFDFAVCSVYRLCSLVVQVLVCVNHHVERVALHSLLRGELCTEAVDPQDQLRGGGGGEIAKPSNY